MTSIIDDFTSLGSRLSEIEKHPKPDTAPDAAAQNIPDAVSQSWVSAPVVWTPENGYGTPAVEVATFYGESAASTAIKDVNDERLKLYQMYGLGYQGDPEWAPW